MTEDVKSLRIKRKRIFWTQTEGIVMCGYKVTIAVLVAVMLAAPSQASISWVDNGGSVDRDISVGFSFFGGDETGIAIEDSFLLTVYTHTRANAVYSEVDLIEGQVLFAFSNSDSRAFIANVYIYDGALAAQLDPFNSLAGTTNFTGPATGGSGLPGFTSTANPPLTWQGFGADVDGATANGIGLNDVLGLGMTLHSTPDQLTIDDVYDALVKGDVDGGLVVGLHVRSIGLGEDSAQFISFNGDDNGNGVVPGPGNGNDAIPEPASLAIWSALALGAAGFAARRRSSRRRWTDEKRRAIYDVVSKA